MKTETDGEKGKDAPHVPFKVDRTLRIGIEAQVTDGLRTAILTGFYKPGEVIPTIDEFAEALGVSIRIPKAALRALTREGLVCPRRRWGTTVAGTSPGVFHGRIVLADPDINPTYYSSVLEKRLCRSLADAGFLVSRVVTPVVERPGGDVSRERFDVRQFEAALRQNTSFVFVIGSFPHLSKVAAERGVPFATIGHHRPPAPSCVGFATLDMGRIIPEVVARLRERGVRRLVQVALHSGEFLDEAAFKTACEAVEGMVVWPEGRLIASQGELMRLAFEAFSRRYRSKADLPDAFLFTDDYLAKGALLALLAAGIRTGRDVLAVTLANHGIEPVHPDPIDLILRDPEADAEAISKALLGYLETGTPPGDIPLGLEYIADFT